MTTTTEETYAEARRRAYNLGYQARREGRDFFDSPYAEGPERDLYLLSDYADGWLSAEAGAQPARARVYATTTGDCAPLPAPEGAAPAEEGEG